MITKDPVTGRMRTVEGPEPIDLARARREAREAIRGDIAFHDDPFTPPKVDIELEFEPMTFDEIIDQAFLALRYGGVDARNIEFPEYYTCGCGRISTDRRCWLCSTGAAT